MNKVLICSPIRREAKILKEFLDGLDNLDLSGIDVGYYFIDDNDDKKSSEMLKDFKKNHKQVLLKQANEIVGKSIEFKTHKNGLHGWDTSLVNRIIKIKDEMIRRADEIGADYVFFVDSDIIMSPPTIKHLIDRKVDIVSEIFWTEWIPGQLYSPNAWLQDEISPFVNPDQKKFDEWQIKRFTSSFYNMLKIPGIYEVGGLGACTLISKKAIKAGVSFRLVDNVSFWGEDRHFCIRARALNLKLFIDTKYPAYHIYRDDLLDGVKNFKKKGFAVENTTFNTKENAPSLPKKIIGRIGRSFKNFGSGLKTTLKSTVRRAKHLYFDMKRLSFAKKRVVNKNPKLTLSMIVKNEEGRYLEEVLAAVYPYIDEAIIIDDGSIDSTVEICKKCLRGKKYEIIKNKKSGFANEGDLRKQQWQETVKTSPDWILVLDADEVPEKKFAEVIPEMIKNADVDVYGFKLYDFWKPGYYRDDALWDAHTRDVHFMIRHQPKFRYRFSNNKQHPGRIPCNALESFTYCNYPLRIKHLGWIKDSDKKAKYERYLKLDPNGEFGSMEQYESILDEKPNLVRFLED